jgi:hypothetical protein
MKITELGINHEVGCRPEIEMKLVGYTNDELLTLNKLASNFYNIKIEREDAAMAATLYGRSKIEFMPRDIKVEKVIFNKPATIIFWSDNTKTVVVCGENDEYDAEKGFFIACAKKLFGNDYKAVGRMNKALEMMTMDDVLLTEEEKYQESKKSDVAIKFTKIKTIIDNRAVDDDEHELLEQIADIIDEEIEK